MTKEPVPALHVAAMPFPTVQGTQAAVHSMLSAHSSQSDEVHLLTYGARQFERPTTPYHIHRTSTDGLDVSFVSGPSFAKFVMDMHLATQLRRLLSTLRPRLIVAHHVEAAMTAFATSRRIPLLFVAHTALGPELPTYFSTMFASGFGWLGRSLDSILPRLVAATAAVSPCLQKTLEKASGRSVRYLPIPWTCPPTITDAERASARAELDIRPETKVILYAGNLDAYQGTSALIEVLARVHSVRRDVVLLLATSSATDAFFSIAHRAGVAHKIHSTLLLGEPLRRVIHAAADIVVIPRRTEGGIPIKLLDALARGIPAVVQHHATAGLPVHDAACVGRAPLELALHVLSLLESAPKADRLTKAGRRYIQQHHSPKLFALRLAESIEDCCPPKRQRIGEVTALARACGRA